MLYLKICQAFSLFQKFKSNFVFPLAFSAETIVAHLLRAPSWPNQLASLPSFQLSQTPRPNHQVASSTSPRPARQRTPAPAPPLTPGMRSPPTVSTPACSHHIYIVPPRHSASPITLCCRFLSCKRRTRACALEFSPRPPFSRRSFHPFLIGT